MKKLFIILMLIAFKSQAQDTTNLLNFGLSARAIEYLAGNIVNPDNEDNFNTFLKWRTAFRAKNPINTTVVTIDTMPVNTAVYLYNWALSSQEGFNFTTSLKSALTPYRANNSNLNRQMTDIENAFQNQIQAVRITGRRWLLGR